MIWDDHKITAFDIETSGEITHKDPDTGKPASHYALQPWRMASGKGWLTSASMIRFVPGEGLCAHLSQLFPTKAQLKQMLEDAIANDWTILGWNIAFDISWLMAFGPDMEELCLRVRWLDGMLLWRHLEIEPEYEFQSARHKKRRWRLKPEAVQQWIPTFAGLDEDVDFHATDDVSLGKLQKYNDRDNVRAWTISKLIWQKLTAQQRKAALIEAEALPMVAQANLHGLAIDRLTTTHLAAKLRIEADALLAELAPDGMTEEIVRSPDKLGKLMFDQWQLPVLKTNKSKVEGKADSRSTDKVVLHELAFIDARAKKVKAYREALNASGKFCGSVLKSLDYSGSDHTYPTSRIFSAYTSRMTVASKQGKGVTAAQIGFALHQMKRGKEFREIVTVPDGFDLVEFDAAGQEARWMAVASGDPSMMQMCMPGEDIHSFMGAAIVGMDYRKMVELVKAEDKTAGQNRYLGKFANLSCCKETSPVLTSRGYVSIENVLPSDLLWDGVEWVSHGGVIFQGLKEVIEHDGIEATADHEVLVEGRWTTLGSARQAGKLVDRAFQGDDRATREAWELHLRDGGSPACAEASQRDAAAMHQRQGRELSQLRGSGDRVSVPVGGGCRALDHGASAAPGLSRAGHRPEGQQQALRAGQPTADLAQGKPAQHAPLSAVGGRPSMGSNAIPLYRADHTQDAAPGDGLPRDHRQGAPGSDRETEGLAPDRGPVAVYDILDAGPRNRFVVNGRIVHNCQYRTSARKLREKARVDYDIPLELPEAQRIHATYQRTYPGVPAYWARQIAIVKQLGYVETFAGRRVSITGDWGGSYGWGMGSTAINYRIQGTGGDQKYLAMMVLKDYLRSIGGRFYFELHDGLYMAIPTRIRDKAAVDIKRMLDNLPYQQAWGFTPPVPMPWDAKAGKSWGSMKEIKFD